MLFKLEKKSKLRNPGMTPLDRHKNNVPTECVNVQKSNPSDFLFNISWIQQQILTHPFG